jgi:hypothetical protein
VWKKERERQYQNKGDSAMDYNNFKLFNFVHMMVKI